MFNFDPTQAQQSQANQSGQITPEQRTLLEADTRLNWAGLLTSLLILPIVFVGIVVGVYFFDTNHETPWYVYVIMILFFGFIELIALVPNLLRIVNTIRVRNDLATGQVEALEGQCAWRRNKYVLETPARRLKYPALSRHLMPGSYRFYFLPNTGLLLSAQRLTPPGGEDPRGELLGVMAQVHHFNMEDLETNRQGRLAGGQIGRLLLRIVWLTVFWVFILGVGLVIAYSIYTSLHSDSAQLWALIITAGIFLLGGAIYLWLVVRLLIDITRGQVTTAQGLVRRTFTVSHSQHGTSTTYYYKLDKLSFTVSASAYTAFIDGPQYRLYYAPLSKTLLAIEPL
jgi:hypothetical protein